MKLDLWQILVFYLNKILEYKKENCFEQYLIFVSDLFKIIIIVIIEQDWLEMGLMSQKQKDLFLKVLIIIIVVFAIIIDIFLIVTIVNTIHIEAIFVIAIIIVIIM